MEQAKQEAMTGLEAIYPELFQRMRQGDKITPDIINSIKGNTSKEIEQKHTEYVEKLKTGKIKPPVPIAPPPKPTAPKKPVRVTRRK